MKKIFAIDDDVEIQNLLKLYLKSKYSFESASNGDEALKTLKASTELPDVILLDVEMPVMNGFTFHKLLKEDSRLKSIPVVYLSANNMFADKVDNETGFDFLNKPIEKEDLLYILETILIQKA